jgi:predicted nucleic acid-binding protein
MAREAGLWERNGRLGFKEFDAYHVASAEAGACDRLVTCDDRFLKTARRNAATIKVTVTDPISLVSEVDF